MGARTAARSRLCGRWPAPCTAPRPPARRQLARATDSRGRRRRCCGAMALSGHGARPSPCDTDACIAYICALCSWVRCERIRIHRCLQECAVLHCARPACTGPAHKARVMHPPLCDCDIYLDAAPGVPCPPRCVRPPRADCSADSSASDPTATGSLLVLVLRSAPAPSLLHTSYDSPRSRRHISSRSIYRIRTPRPCPCDCRVRRSHPAAALRGGPAGRLHPVRPATPPSMPLGSRDVRVRSAASFPECRPPPR